MLARWAAEAPPGFVEPLQRPDRIHMGTIPADRQDVEDMYVRSRLCFWEETEVDCAHDTNHWRELSDGARFFLCRVLAFFSQSDAIVAENCSVNFGKEITWPEFQQLFAWQAQMEWIHARTYSLLLNTYVRDDAERAALETSISTIPTIGAKAAWVRSYMHDDTPLAARLAAFVVCEGIFFSASFCAINWFKKQGKLPGLCFSNELIARDEALHTLTSTLAYSKLERRLPQAYVHALFADAVDIERAFVREAIPVSLLGMNSDAMCTYVEFVADFWLVRLGYAKLFGAANPFDWQDLQSMTGKTNFFERKVGEYARALHGGAASDTAGSEGGAGAGAGAGARAGAGAGEDAGAGTGEKGVRVAARHATLQDAFAGDVDF
jgi:ribonucleoside-diphosphate reductase beta chain